MNTTIATNTPLTLDQERAALDSREEMLKTLHLAYQNALDDSDRVLSSVFEGVKRQNRLLADEQGDLGRRLALYWDMGRDILPKPEPRTPYRSHAEEIDALLKKWNESRSELHGDEGGEVVGK